MLTTLGPIDHQVLLVTYILGREPLVEAKSKL